MDDDYISIGPGDTITVTEDPDGYPAIKIQDTVFEEEPRWLLFHFPGGDQATRIDELIGALVELRDAERTAPRES